MHYIQNVLFHETTNGTALPPALVTQLAVMPALQMVVTHVTRLCPDYDALSASLSSLSRMVTALPKPLRGDIPAASLAKLGALTYDELTALCRLQIQYQRRHCSRLYPLLTAADFFPSDDHRVNRAREIMVVLLTELALMSQLLEATGIAQKAGPDESGVTSISEVQTQRR